MGESSSGSNLILSGISDTLEHMFDTTERIVLGAVCVVQIGIGVLGVLAQPVAMAVGLSTGVFGLTLVVLN